ncbi:MULTISPECIES: hypothetical protein [unclassified Hydrogenophaga]|jgi:hypothetical protein|uniref:hypothetical protein n=1 Tax=unclassified Hydrogenophaga TaxID=2610897 RepID=UPI0013204F26|nr:MULTISPECIES: hypothetical protein [unclassified Hydrogenophaga]QHE78761.1 hypothetical protein F9Z45_21780 [Hydrogenophaga sp. PBL-H3]QHE83186.1 hypothetical protein F9Z44_21780 [Hydrogenophaga sp. PBL-H3]
MFFIDYARFEGNTTQASSQAIALLQHDDFKFAVFSTSPDSADGTEKPADGPETNWPYFSAAIRVGDNVHIFDSTLLSAARYPRGSEVRDILDVAVQMGSVYFTQGVAGFTAGLSPEAAARRFAGVPLTALTKETRSDFWLKVSRGIPEYEFFKQATI